MSHEVTFQLPLPPSVNGLYATDFKTRRRFQTLAYKTWEAQADKSLFNQFAGKHPCLSGRIGVIYMLGRPNKRKADCFNREKALSDFLVKNRIIEDDSLIELGSIGWTDEHPGIVDVLISSVEAG